MANRLPPGFSLDPLPNWSLPEGFRLDPLEERPLPFMDGMQPETVAERFSGTPAGRYDYENQPLGKTQERVDRGSNARARVRDAERAADLKAPEDDWATLGRKMINKVVPIAKREVGGALQWLAESGYDSGDDAFLAGDLVEMRDQYQAKLDEARARGEVPGQKLAAEAQRDIDENGYNFGDSSSKYYATMIGENLIQMVPTILATVATRSPAPGLALMGGQVGGRQYADSRDAGRSPDAATADAIFMGAAELIGEQVPLGMLIRPGGTFLKNTLKTAGAEGVQEMFTEIMQTGYSAGVLNEDMTWGEAVRSVVDAGIIGAGMGAGMSTIARPFRRAETPGFVEAANEAPSLTPEDLASPLPTDALNIGKTVMQGAAAKSDADAVLARNAVPAIGKRVDFMGQEATVADAFRDEDGEGVTLEIGGQTQKVYFSDLADAGVSLTEVATPGPLYGTMPDPAKGDVVDLSVNTPVLEPSESTPVITAPEPQISATKAGESTPAITTSAEQLKARIRQVESGGNDAADNPNSTASGRYQFTDSTFASYYRKVFRDEPPEGAKNDPAVQERLMDALVADNAAALKAAGFEPTAGNLYLAHFLGANGALAVLRNPNGSAEEMLGKGVADANGDIIRGKTGAEVAAWAAGKMGDAQIAVTDTSPETEDSGTTAALLAEINKEPAAGSAETLAMPMPEPEAEAQDSVSELLARDEAGRQTERQQPATTAAPEIAATDPRTVYHGGPGITGDIRAPLFVSESPEFAKTYAEDRGRGAGKVEAFHFTPKNTATEADIVDAARAAGVSDIALSQMTGGMLLDESFTEQAQQIVAELRRRGFDSARFNDFAVDEETTPQPTIAILDPSVLSAPTTNIPENIPEPAVPSEPAASSPAAGPSQGAGGRGASPAPVFRTPRARTAKGPEDVLSFIKRHGGIRNDEGHDLYKGRGLGTRPGLIRRNGRTVDEVGELLHEAGYFVERPTTAQVLELLDRANTRKVYKPDEQAAADEAARDRDLSAQEADVRDEILAMAEKIGLTFRADDVDAALNYVAAGETIDAAIERAMYEAAADAIDFLASDTESDYYARPAAYEGEQAEPRGEADDTRSQDGPDREAPEGVAGSDGVARSEGRGDGADAQPDRAGETRQGQGAEEQLDAFGTRPDDQRKALERQAEGRKKGKAAQKAPGSDGGLFDTVETTADAFAQPDRLQPFAAELDRIGIPENIRDGLRNAPADYDIPRFLREWEEGLERSEEETLARAQGQGDLEGLVEASTIAERKAKRAQPADPIVQARDALQTAMAALDAVQAPQNERLEDAGEKIGGARKDRWAARGLALSDLEGMAQGEAFQFVTKDQVWPKPDYAKMVEDGVTPEAAAAVKLLRDSLAAKPKTDSDQARRDYIETMGVARRLLESVRTIDDLSGIRDRLFDAIGFSTDWKLSRSEEQKVPRRKLFSIAKGNSFSFSIGYNEKNKIRKMVAEGFPTSKAEPWTRRFRVVEYARKDAERPWFVTGNTQANRRIMIDQGFATQAEAEAAAKALYENKDEDGTKKAPERPHLDEVRRTGEDVRGGRDIGSEDFISEFGFRGVEYGNWAASDERQKITNLAFEALHDLANVLGIPPKAISLDGQLAMAFGARGASRFAAHYEPGKLVINMTKLNGAGSLAHEWGHALDHYFGTLDTDLGTRGAPKGASGWYDRTDSRLKALGNLRPEMAAAFDRLMSAIFQRDMTLAEEVRAIEHRIEKLQAGIERQKAAVERHQQNSEGKPDKKFLKQSNDWIEMQERVLLNQGQILAELTNGTRPPTARKVESSYYANAKALSGKSGEKGYWARPTEMLARSFESFVFDRIAERGNVSQYLVQGVEDSRYAEGYKGDPYPAGDERKAINDAYADLFRTMAVREGSSGNPALYSFDTAADGRNLLAGDAAPMESWPNVASDLYARLERLKIGDKARLELVGLLFNPQTGQPDRRVAGRYFNDTITVALASVQDPNFTISHEAWHFLDEHMIRPAERTAMNKAALADEDLMASIRKRYAHLSEAQQMEEARADLFAKRGDFTPKGFVRDAFDRIIYFLKSLGEALRMHFLTADDVIAAIERGDVGARPGRLSAAERERLMVAWHGTPHEWEGDRADTTKIGTGEGAQVYGWGLYFAGKKDVAEFYRNKLSGNRRPIVRWKGRLIGEVQAEYGMAQYTQDMWNSLEGLGAVAIAGSVEQAIANLQDQTKRPSVYNIEGALSWLEAHKDEISVDTPGRLYEVDIPEDGEYLLWDKGLSEQPEQVQQALAMIPQNVRDAIDDMLDERGMNPMEFDDDAYTGMHLYRMLTNVASEGVLDGDIDSSTMNDEGDPKEAASRFLHSFGIAGIKYLDGSSRTAGDGTYNYVVFDDARVQVLGKFSIADTPQNGVRTPDANATPDTRRTGSAASQDGEGAGLASRGIAEESGPEGLGPKFSIVGEPDADPQRLSDLLNHTTAAVDGFDSLKGKAADVVDAIRVPLQDRMLPVLRTQMAAEKVLGRPIAENENPYREEELMVGRVGAALEQLTDKHIDPLFEAMRQEKITPDELETYLYARHAPERNAEIAKINPAFAAGGGSGMTDLEAKAIMARIGKEGRTSAFERVAALYDGLRDFSIDFRVEAGLMSQEQADQWRKKYPHYAPLRGFSEMNERPSTSRGISVRGPESKRAFGRRSKAEDILAHTIMQAEEAIVRGHKNLVAQEFYNLARAAKDDSFWKLHKVQVKREVSPETGMMEEKIVTELAPGDENYTVFLKVNGEHKRVTMQRGNPAAERLAAAMRRLDETQMNLITRLGSQVNRYLSTVNTALNPEFVITNAFRDFQTATANLAGIDVEGIIAGTIKDYPAALKASMKGAFKKDDGGAWAKSWQEFTLAGGRVFYNQMQDIEQLRRDIAKRVQRSQIGVGGKRRTAAEMAMLAKSDMKAVFDFIGNVNLGVENAIRLSAFKNARERGMSVKDAAAMAKNLTVNFNKKGTWGVALNAMYLFYNASIQGSARIMLGLKHKRVRRVVYGMVATGAAVELLNVMLSGADDDDEPYYDKISDFDKSRNLIIMTPWMDGVSGKGSHIKIPLPYGFNTFYALGRAGAEIGRGKPFWHVFGNLAGTFVDAFNPIGGTDSLANFIAPTLVDPAIDLFVDNRDFADKPIMPDQPQYGPPVPDNQRYWASVAPHWKAVTDFMNKASGGDDVVPGSIDVSPETLEYMFGVAVGAAGAFLDRSASLAFKVGQKMEGDPDVEFERNDFPMVRKLVGSKPGWYDKAAFYARLEEIEGVVADAKDYREIGDEAGLDRLIENRGDILDLHKLAKAARKEMKSIRKDKATLELARERGAVDDALYQERMSALLEDEQTVITRFNQIYFNNARQPIGPR